MALLRFVRISQQQQGQTVILIVSVILSLFVIIVLSVGTITVVEQKKNPIDINTVQSFYTAEAAIEDTLLRVMDSSLSYDVLTPITLNNATASVSITQSGSTLTIATTADRNNQIRKLEAKLSSNTTGVSFNYGVLAGGGGFELENTSSIIGNVYANGNIDGAGGNIIQGDAWVVGGSGILSDVYVKDDAHAHTISNTSVDGSAYGYTISSSTIGGNAYANTITGSFIGGNAYYTSISGSVVGGEQFPGYPGSADPPSQSMPISSSQIDAWKTEAEAGGVVGSYTLDGAGTTASLGPKKIAGNLSTRNSAQLTLTGTLWVTGNVTMEQSSVIQLHPSYGTTSGVLIVDGTISLTQSALVCGSEGYGSGSCNPFNQSYLLLLSTSSADPAISFNQSGAVNGILYAPNGVLQIGQSASLKEATAYKIEMKNSATIIYESGLINTSFSSGPSGGWDITSWKEL